MMDEQAAVLVFIQSGFAGALSRPCNSLIDLIDGRLINDMLHSIAPSHFDADMVDQSEGSASNWALCLTNLKKISRSLDSYYKNVLSKEISNLDTIDLQSIAKSQDLDEVLNVMELVIGAAVMCEDKARFIKKIFSLDSTVQTVLKALIEQNMSRLVDCDSSRFSIGSESGDHIESQNPAGAAAMIAELQQVIGHLHSERQKLLGDIHDLKSHSTASQSDAESLRCQVTELLRERENWEAAEARQTSTQSSQTQQVARELDECRRQLDLKVVEFDTFQVQHTALEQRLKASRELVAKLEMESTATADEMDLLRDKAARLTKAEGALEKYKTKLEELPALKRENKELLGKMDEYLDKIQGLEGAAKGTATLTRMLEQYKNRACELEREKFDLQSAAQMQVAELEKLRIETDDHLEARKFLEEELVSLRQDVEATGTRSSHSSSFSRAGAGGLRNDDTLEDDGVDGGLLGDEVSTVTLRERLKLAERELKSLRLSTGPASAPAADSIGLESSYQLLLQNPAAAVAELAMVRAELEDALRAKREREEMLLACRKQLADSKIELDRAVRSLHEQASTGAPPALPQDGTATSMSTKSAANDKVSRESESKLAQALNTCKLLEDRLKETEGSVNRLEQDKDQLEIFSRSTLSSFKEKFAGEMARWKDERKALESKLASLQKSAERNLMTHKNEQRLISSALYEIGGKMVDSCISAESMTSASDRNGGSSTFLQSQRNAQIRILDAQLAQGGAPSTPGTPLTPSVR